ncbi:MAG TPA: oligopeptide:H+ symporter, partial [Thermoanaerobaculia bacterium]
MHAGGAVTLEAKGFFGHPAGLSTLFFTELWERFSYYGMRAILLLFMTAAVAEGGLGWDAAKAGPIYGLYTAMVYLTALPGGWIADRLLGQRRSVLLGGIIIALGHLSLTFHSLGSFYLGLVLIVTGTGFLKPNISAMVGGLYTPEDARRDAGFSMFYMGINIGGFIAPLVVGFLAQ